MQGLILAAGRGSRMQHCTADRPKCLVRLAGKSLVQWQTEALQQAGVARTAVVAGYRGEMLANVGAVQFDNPRWQESNMVRSLLCADAWLSSDECIISYSDIVYHPDVVRSLAAADDRLAITYDTRWHELWSLRFEDPLRDAETFQVDDARRVRDIGRRPSRLEEVQGQYMGLIKTTPLVWKEVCAQLSACTSDEVDRLDMTSLLRRLIHSGTEVVGVPISGRWCEVDSDRDLELYEAILREERPWSHDWRA